MSHEGRVPRWRLSRMPHDYALERSANPALGAREEGEEVKLNWKRNLGIWTATTSKCEYELEKTGFRDEDGCWHENLWELNFSFGGRPPYRHQIFADSKFTFKAAKKLAQAHSDCFEEMP